MNSPDAVSSPFLPLPDGIIIQAVEARDSDIIVKIACVRPHAACPGCGHPSERIHSSYGRRVADVPCGGRQVTLALTVRKFVCGVCTCPHKIFTERLSEFVLSYGRLTNRLREAIQALGFATCAEAGVRLAPKLGMSVTATTLLRRMRDRTILPPETVCILGVDDWAWRKGLTYGTLLVDLEIHQPIEVLPDRKKETLEAWLRLHPEVEVVSRDRAGAYAEAVRSAAPQALEVADRFHLLKNLREHLRDFLLRQQASLPEVEEAAHDAIPHKARGRPRSASPPSSPSDQEKQTFRKMSANLRVYEDRATTQTQLTLAQERKQASRARRLARYEAVRELHQQGLSGRAIARQLKLSRRKVMQFIQAESFPERAASVPKPSILDPYKPFILERWAQGCHNGTQISQEIKMAGYTGSEPLLRLFITQLRKQQRSEPVDVPLSAREAPCSQPPATPPSPPKLRLSPTRASWLCVSPPKKRDEQDQRLLSQLRGGHPDLEKAYQLAQAFVSMLSERRAADVEGWLATAEQSGIAELKRFASGIRRDYAAVHAAFSSEWSNGQVEGQVGRLKLQKRIVYGRANFDLLRLRVLSHA